MRRTLLTGIAALVLLGGLVLVRRIPAAALMIIIAIAGGMAGHAATPSARVVWSVAMVVPSVGDLYPHAAPRASERNVALSSGIANMLLAPLGAMPMCHGAGGVQAIKRRARAG